MSDSEAPPPEDIEERIRQRISSRVDEKIAARVSQRVEQKIAERQPRTLFSGIQGDIPEVSVSDAGTTNAFTPTERVAGRDGLPFATPKKPDVGAFDQYAKRLRATQEGIDKDFMENKSGEATGPLNAVWRAAFPGYALKSIGESVSTGSLEPMVGGGIKRMSDAARGAGAYIGKAASPITTYLGMAHEAIDNELGARPDSLGGQAAKATLDFATGRPLLEGMQGVGQAMQSAKEGLEDIGVDRDVANIGVEGAAELLPLAAIRFGSKLKAAGRAGRVARAVADDVAIASSEAAAATAPKVMFDDLVMRQMNRGAQLEKTFNEALDIARLERSDELMNAPQFQPEFLDTDPAARTVSGLWENPATRWMVPVAQKMEEAAGAAGLKWAPKLIGDSFASKVRQLDGAAAVAELSATRAVESLEDVMVGLGDARRQQVRDFMMGEIHDVSALPKETVEQAARLKGLIHHLGMERMKRGGLTDATMREFEQGFLARIFEKPNEGRFPFRKNKVQHLGLEYPEIRRDSPGVIVRGLPTGQVEALAEGFNTRLAKDYGEGRYLVKFQKDDVASRDLFVKRLNDPFTREQLGITGEHSVRKLEQLTAEQLKELGEALDPSVPLYETVYRNEKWIADYDFLNSLNDMSTDEIGRFVVDEPTAGYKPVTADGPLKGKHLHEKVVGALNDRFDFDGTAAKGGAIQFGKDVWDGFLSGWKLNKTVLSPRTMARQVYSMPYFMGYGGLRGAKHLPEAIRSMRKGTAAYRKWNDLFAQYGIDGGARFTDAEISKAFRRMHDSKDMKSVPVPFSNREFRFTPRELGMWMSAPWAETNLAKGAAKLYNVPDIATRKALFMHYVDDLKMSPARAATEVNKWTPNYAEVGKTVDWMRRSPLGAPFFTFRAEMYRIQANALREKPLVFAAQMGSDLALKAMMGYVLGDLVGAWGEDDELIESEKRAIELTRGSGSVPSYRDEDGRMRVLDMGYINPNRDSMELFTRGSDLLLNAVGSDWRLNPYAEHNLYDNPLLEAANAVGVDASPGVSIPMKMLQGVDPRTGQEVDQSLGTLAEDIMPGMTPGVGRDWQKMQASLEGEQPSKYRGIQDPLSMAFDSILGLTSTPLEPKLDQLRLVRRMRSLLGKEKRKYKDDDQTRDETIENIERIANKAKTPLEALGQVRRKTAGERR